MKSGLAAPFVLSAAGVILITISGRLGGEVDLQARRGGGRAGRRGGVG